MGEWSRASALLGRDGQLEEAAAHFAKHVRVTSEKSVEDAVAEFVASRETAGRSVRHVADLRGRLEKFGAAFRCPMSHVGEGDVSAWLASLGNLSARSVNNYLQSVSSLARFAERRGWLPSTHPLLILERRSITPREIRILTPAVFRDTLHACRREMVPFVLLASFCGIRHAELTRMTWRNIHLTDSDPTMPHGWVEVRADESKNAAKLGHRARRLIPICPALARALLPLRKSAAAPICPFTKADNQLAKLTKVAGVAWSENVLRHSFGSYRLAITADEGKVAQEMGNSPSMIFAHYRAVVSARAAAEWFATNCEQVERMLDTQCLG